MWSPPVTRPAPEANLPMPGLLTVFSSEGTRWAGLPLTLSRLEPGCQIDIHVNNPHVTRILLSAETSWLAAGARHRCWLRPGTSIFLRAHYSLAGLISDRGVDGINVALEPEHIAKLWHDDLSHMGHDFLDHVVASDHQVIGIIDAMYSEVSAGSPAGPLFGQSLSVALLAHLYDRYDRVRCSKRVEGRLSDRQVEVISKYVKANIGIDLSLSSMAQLLKLSPAYFCRAFTKTTGISPHRFIMNERITAARQILQRNPIADLAEVASALGFSSHAHFSSVFRKLTGCTPSAFRREI